MRNCQPRFSILDATSNRKKLATQKFAQNKKHFANNQCTFEAKKKASLDIVDHLNSIKSQTIRVEAGNCIILKNVFGRKCNNFLNFFPSRSLSILRLMMSTFRYINQDQYYKWLTLNPLRNCLIMIEYQNYRNISQLMQQNDLNFGNKIKQCSHLFLTLQV